MRKILGCAALLLCVVMSRAGCAADGGPVVVVTSLLPLYSIGSALAEGTAIDVRTVPDALPGMLQLPRALSRQNAESASQLRGADAVITLTSVWPDDPLFREARAQNIRIVHIDAARSLAKGGSSVMLMATPGSTMPRRIAPASGADSPYVWFSIANGIRMAEIIAADFERLAPADAGRIEKNLGGFSSELLALRAEYDAKFLSLADQPVFSLTERFVYLTNEFGIYIEGYFLEDDVRWESADYDKFSALLADRGIRHVLHHWEPNEAVNAAVTRGGAKLLVLDDEENSKGARPAKPDRRAYQMLLRTSLDVLYRALAG